MASAVTAMGDMTVLEQTGHFMFLQIIGRRVVIAYRAALPPD